MNTTQIMKQVGNRQIPQEMFDEIAREFENCRLALVAGFNKAEALQLYKELCDLCYNFGLPIDAFR